MVLWQKKCVRKRPLLLWAAILAALVIAVVCGCGGGSGGNILYALGLGSPSVRILQISSAGALIGIDSVSTGASPNAMAIDPLVRFAYVLSSSGGVGLGGVSQYVVGKGGRLTVATFSSTGGTGAASTPVVTGTNPAAIVEDTSGLYVFVASRGTNPVNPSCSPITVLCGPSISVFAVDQVGGTLLEVKQPISGTPPPNCLPNQPDPCPLGIPAAPNALATTGKLLLVAVPGTGQVSAYPFNSSGVLDTTNVVTTTVGGSPSAMALDPSGKFVFVTDPAANTVAAFSIGSSGALTAVGSPVATGTTPVSVHVQPSGNFLYTANRGSGDISAFSLNSSGALSPLSGSPFTVLPGNTPTYVTSGGSGTFLFVANGGTNNITVFAVDSSGALKQVTGSPFASGVLNPIALASP